MPTRCWQAAARSICIHEHFVRATARRAYSARVNVLLYKSDDTPTFVILVARSFARDVWQTLRQAAVPYGYPS